mmetsp:Transcript_218/g.750  ORF Transcript_218/g.750 Transcript_218/m.750 type:complete len:320 (-) Transcript_218:40-999(-)|eukprot:CAMPEP_0114612064 /NCGR_PEP_ID=MMETSP0168-20121206/4433_1 /TAXON_ID=95228 ORGANISM="Vannella sp., Strain DIVA3 517/6/12" /NCGR_SAMPLE_ID=MMETSP0168 /ASSEMBLY_ACC=CAM_ASM_000044 /LENGTH=319 /DNA_ID=CAMNT_0001823045 /DNA_START=63 /DNA_END=1022 /DNA_ORIENTATION=-
MSWGKTTVCVLLALLAQQVLRGYLAPGERLGTRGLEHKSVQSVYLSVGADEAKRACEEGRERESSASEIERYRTAVGHASELSLHHKHVFLGLTPILLEPDLGLFWAVDNNGNARVLMTAWSRRRHFDSCDNGARGYPRPFRSPSSLFVIPDHWRTHATGREIWLTPAPHLLSFCLAAKSPTWAVAGEAALQLRITQLLGLPPTCTYSDVVSIWVKPSDVFRPCYDPEVEDYECQQDFTGSSRAYVSEEHVKWMTDRERQLQQQVLPAVPWTRLGFTYDWGDQEHHIGLSEYVCKAGADLIVHSVLPALAYCTPATVAY